ncbi:hypothetical protein Cadr_000016940 [Camelus dromedarius]|uniref:Uncharacterized protein n=1 Tax=Camelus dromedarius TaxID=9838 RepID=A0A5N4DG57_CAMDR|nr:hypothetical protein Cadr_000016940 [Camelus dromedarius]
MEADWMWEKEGSCLGSSGAPGAERGRAGGAAGVGREFQRCPVRGICKGPGSCGHHKHRAQQRGLGSQLASRKACLPHGPAWTIPWGLLDWGRIPGGLGPGRGLRFSLHQSVPPPTSGACAPRCGGEDSGWGLLPLCPAYLRGRVEEQ